MKWLLILPFALQGLVILVDEFYFHWKRDLPMWERVGHPLDVCTLLACFGWLVYRPFNESNLITYICLAAFSCIFVTKDEWVHTRLCEPGEQWLHSLLFLLQPAALISACTIWALASNAGTAASSPWAAAAEDLLFMLPLQIALQVGFLAYQLIYWGILRSPYTPTDSSTYDSKAAQTA